MDKFFNCIKKKFDRIKSQMYNQFLHYVISEL